MKNKINYLIYNKFMVFVIFLFFLLPYCKIGDSYLNIVNIVNLAITVIVIFLYIINSKTNKFILMLIFMLSFFMISSIRSTTTSIVYFFNTYYRILGITLYLDMGVREYSENILKSANFCFLILIFINLLSIIIYPKGIPNAGYNVWFFRLDNLHCFMYLPGLLIAKICKEEYKGKYNIIYYVMFLICLYSTFYCFSATSVVGITLLTLGELFNILKIKQNPFTIKTAVIVCCSIFIGIVILRVQNIFSWLIVDILGKSLTFTNRTIVWDKIIALISKKPILGYGVESTTVIANKLGNVNYTHAHNTFLDIIYKGGIVTFAIFINMLKITLSKVKQIENVKIKRFISSLFLAILVMINFESREENIGLYIILILVYHITEILTIKNEERNS